MKELEEEATGAAATRAMYVSTDSRPAPVAPYEQHQDVTSAPTVVQRVLDDKAQGWLRIIALPASSVSTMHQTTASSARWGWRTMQCLQEATPLDSSSPQGPAQSRGASCVAGGGRGKERKGGGG